MTNEQKIARIEELKNIIKQEHEKGNCSDEVVKMIVELTSLAKEVVCSY